MRGWTTFAALALITLLPLGLSAQEEVNAGDTVTVNTLNDRARLCPVPNCGSGEHIARISTDTRLVVEKAREVETGMFCIRWFRVTVHDVTGWISEFSTDVAFDKPKRC